MLINTFFGILAGGLMGFSSVADSYEMIIIGRLIVGFHCGECSLTFFSKKKHQFLDSTSWSTEHIRISTSSLVARRFTLVVAFGILLEYLGGGMQGTTKAILLFFDCRLSGGDTQRWWVQSSFTCCNQKN